MSIIPTIDDQDLPSNIKLNHCSSSDPIVGIIPRGSVNERKFHCGLCDDKFTRIYSLRQHLKKHGNPCWCQRCCLTFATEEEVVQHEKERLMNDSLVGIETYPCNECEVKSKSMCDQQRHALNHLMYQCPTCNLTFTTERNLNTHNQEHISGIVYPCSTCGTMFQSQKSLRAHQKKHRSKLCGICGVMVTSNYKVHMEKHEGKTYKCTYEGCGKTLSTKSILLAHSRSHYKQRRFPCYFEGCFLKFYTDKALTQHKKMHFGIKRYKCTFEDCTSAFHQRFDLKVHLRRHTGEKPFECAGCSECFFTRSLLRKHLEKCPFAMDNNDI